jgi:hypothetical protein
VDRLLAVPPGLQVDLLHRAALRYAENSAPATYSSPGPPPRRWPAGGLHRLNGRRPLCLQRGRDHRLLWDPVTCARCGRRPELAALRRRRWPTGSSTPTRTARSTPSAPPGHRLLRHPQDLRPAVDRRNPHRRHHLRLARSGQRDGLRAMGPRQLTGGLQATARDQWRDAWWSCRAESEGEQGPGGIAGVVATGGGNVGVAAEPLGIPMPRLRRMAMAWGHCRSGSGRHHSRLCAELLDRRLADCDAQLFLRVSTRSMQQRPMSSPSACRDQRRCPTRHPRGSRMLPYQPRP